MFPRLAAWKNTFLLYANINLERMVVMKQPFIKVTSGESILTQPHRKFKSFNKNYSLISENYIKINRYFGIEENGSDQIWFYGFFATSIFIMLFTYLFSGILYGF
ncbi:DUF3961 domain-containing protein [Bacillus thuringiensis]|uniref:DUF3961 domain-containing protein n=1 Tax=Bacillus thuringiensis TaxID=1428 RepID=UPI003D12592D